MNSIKNQKGEGASPQLGEWRQSLQRLSMGPSAFGQGMGGLNTSHLSGMGATNASFMNRNSNIKKVIRGGNGSVYHKGRASSTYGSHMKMNSLDGNTGGDEVQFLQNLLAENNETEQPQVNKSM